MLRQKRRSFVTILSTAVSMLGMLFYVSIMNGMMKETVDAAIGLRLANVTVDLAKEGEDIPFTLSNETIGKIKQIPGVKGVGMHVIRDGLVTSADVAVSGGSRGVRLIGVEPRLELDASTVPGMIAKYRENHGEGEYLRNEHDTTDPEIVIGREMAEKLQVRVGDYVIVTVIQSVKEEESGENSSDARVALRVAGIFQSADGSFEKTSAFVHRDLLYNIVGVIEKPEVYQYSIITEMEKEKEISGEVNRLIDAEFGHAPLKPTARTWKEKDPFLSSNVDLFESFNYIFLFLIFFTSSFIIVNTLLMVVQERFREFGILKAMGASPSTIAWMIVIEGFLLGLSGAILGMIMSFPIVGLYYYIGLDLSVFGDGLKSFGMPTVLHPFLYEADLVLTTSTVVILAIMGSLYPAVKAARIRTLDAIHFT